MVLLLVDSQAWIITIVGWLIVFAALVVLVIVFNNVPRLMNINFKKKASKKQIQQLSDSDDKKYLSGDETAAIAMALHLFFEEQHDEESNIITIKRIERRYSPWSSKIYGVRNFPR
jgi:Na+-transporting methylmalonyl-CoA/oxaloacetate decarboxylase gamma subunit